MVEVLIHVERREFERTDMAFLQDKLDHSPAGPAYRSFYVWLLAGLGRTGEAAEAIVLLGDATHAQVIYDRLAPYAGRPATSGRAVLSYGAVDRHLGGLAAVLGRHDEALGHLRAAIARNDELGCAVWAEHARRQVRAVTSAGTTT